MDVNQHLVTNCFLVSTFKKFSQAWVLHMYSSFDFHIPCFIVWMLWFLLKILVYKDAIVLVG